MRGIVLSITVNTTLTKTPTEIAIKVVGVLFTLGVFFTLTVMVTTSFNKVFNSWCVVD